jgi:hypothetical protein
MKITARSVVFEEDSNQYHQIDPLLFLGRFSASSLSMLASEQKLPLY